MLSNLSISQKLYAGFAVLLAIILLLVLSSWRGFNQVNSAVASNIHTYTVISEADALLSSLINIETGMRGYAISGKDTFLAPLQEGERAFSESYTMLKRLTADNPAQQRRLDEIQRLKQQWFAEDIQANVDLRREIASGQAQMDAIVERISEGRDKAKMDAMRGQIAELRSEEEKLLGSRSEEMDSASSTALGILIGGGVLVGVLAVIIALTLSASIVGRLRHAVDVARAIADGRLDSRIDNRGGDEIGTLLAAFSAMQERLRGMITQIKQGAEQLVQASQHISSSSEQLSVSAREQSHAAASMAATVEELTVSINHVAENAGEAHAISSASGQQSQDGGKVIQNTLESMQKIANTVQQSASQIAELGQHSDQITSIVNVIKAIADQTNLLALNAAIEAARAGEQGRGFAVVADEVRLLAQRTGNSTQEIAEMVQKIQQGTRHAVDNMEVGVALVNNGVEQANQAGEAIVQIRDGSSRVISVVDQISIALREQTEASQDVARNVERIAQMSQQNSQAVEETSLTAHSLNQLAKGLEQQVAQFRL
ncbi:methyl-accepting chemotaxis protein [Pseudomonas sp. UBA2684]|uniref:methyl-accepting chemotaxis protein n=1 Tax=uncultured Pseudomonas sp. TaxID=114707 RepID=UPI0025DB1984|nr:methyl-accepting chemotaxis protein [Pseudomonas sp. UBA2684]|tara:strand:- start:9345 stop:10976 length:1632 start_codon:yes stop_codon:yes gene_type:complete